MTEPIPQLTLRRDTEELDRALTDAFRRVLESGRYILGPEVEAFETECANYLGGRHAIGLSSGTDALLVALMALDIGPGDEVIVPTYTFFATAGCVARLGAKIVFVDSDPDDLNLDPARVADAITAETRAVIAVHLFGRCANMGALREVCGDDVVIVEDAAQAIGAGRPEARAGTLGAMGTFSFFPSKNLGALGDGGLLSTDDDALAERTRTLRAHGAKPKYVHHEIGGNFRLDALQAAFLRVKLARLEAAHARRITIAERYRAALSGSPIIVPSARDGERHVFNQYVIRFEDRARRDRAQAALRNSGIGSAIYYPIPLHRQACFAHLGYAEGDLPVAERASATSLALPIFPELRDGEVDRITDTLLAARI